MFGELTAVIERFTATGKLEWRGLAATAIDALTSILNAQFQVLNAAGGPGSGLLGSILGSVLGLFGGFGGDSGGGSAPANARYQNASGGLIGHTGGIVGGDALPRRLVDPAVLGGAARLAMGGIAGLAPDEVPAILHGGEGIFTPGQMRALGRGGGGAQAPAPQPNFKVTVINNTGEPARVQQRRTPGGGRQVDVVIGEIAAKDVLRGGPLHRAIRLAFGVNPTTVTR